MIIDAKAIWEQVKMNRAALDSCAGPHDFQDITPEQPFGKRYRCSRCGGKAEGHDVRWYKLGLQHGGAQRG